MHDVWRGTSYSVLSIFFSVVVETFQEFVVHSFTFCHRSHPICAGTLAECYYQSKRLLWRRKEKENVEKQP